MKSKFKIKGPIFIGRSWAEYMKMFDLDEEYLKDKPTLDCAAGASSFTAHMSRRGFDATAVDILYDRSFKFLQERCKKHLYILVDALSEMKNHFVWSFFTDLDDLRMHRMAACREFIEDYKKYKGKKYIKADLTQLPFSDNSFHLILCSHLLFIYDHRLSYRFHIDSIKEMLRVSSKEVRIYPLIKHNLKKSLFVDGIMEELKGKANVEIVKVDYEFRKGGYEMMKIIK